MKTLEHAPRIVKSTTTAFEIGNHTVIGANWDTFYVKTSDGIMEYETSEMKEIYGATFKELQNMREVLNR